MNAARDPVAVHDRARARRSRRPCRRCRGRGAVCASKMSAPSGSSRAQLGVPAGQRAPLRALDAASSTRDSEAARALEAIPATIRAVPDVLIYGDTVRSPELRHEVPLAIPDPFLYVERERRAARRRRRSLEIAAARAIAGGLEPHAFEEFGYDELIAQRAAARRGAAPGRVAPCGRSASTRRSCRATFPLELADRPASEGVELTPDARALRGAPPGQERGRARRDPPRAARGRGGDGRGPRAAAARRARTAPVLVVDGEPLTSERIKARDRARSSPSTALVADEFIVSHGAAERGRPRHGLRADPGRRADRDRPLAARPRDRAATPT